MKRFLFKNFIPVLLFFILITFLVLLFWKLLESFGFNIPFLLGANFLLFLLSFFVFLIQTRTVKSISIHAFIRGVYSSLLLKLFIIAGTILVYAIPFHGDVNLPSLFTAMGLYLVYTSIEVIQLMKIVRKKTDA
jgi:hypothetical protein